jgi:hypothetical protein
LPIIDPRKANSGRPLPASPEILRKQLVQSATAGVAEVEAFKSTWQSEAMKSIWDWMETKLQESNGDFPQPTGMWERDYDVILQGLEKEELEKEQQRKTEEEQQEQSRILSSEGDRNAVFDSFKDRNLPGVRLLKGRNEAVIVFALLTTGMIFEIQEIPTSANAGIPDWEVTIKQSPGQARTKLENAVISVLNDRPRKWDLAYLLVSDETALSSFLILKIYIDKA